MSRRLPVVAAALAALVAAVPASAGAPAATTGPATSIGARSAIVSGTVDPGGKGTTWSIEYGTTSAYGSRSDARSAGNGTSAVDVTHQLTGLSTGVTYYYRVVASNDDGTSRGAGMTFTTRGAPEVRTGAAALIGPGAANLGGTVDPNGRSTGWWVEYGTTSRYGNRTETRSAGAGVSPVGVAVRVGGLTAGVTYHFRLVAANDIGTTAGGDVELPHGQRSHRLDRWSGLHHADVGARQRPRRPAGPRHGRVVRVRHDDAARQPNGRHQRRLRARRLDPAVDDRRPPAGNGLPLPHRRAKRRRHDVRADPELPDERRAARDDRRRDPLRALRHPHGNGRPRRSRDDRLVRARADDRLRHANGRQAGGLGPRRCRRLRDGGRPHTRHRVPRAPRRPELGRDDVRRRRRLPDARASRPSGVRARPESLSRGR